MLFLQVFCFSKFSFEILSTHFAMHCDECLFHTDNHIIKLEGSWLWKLLQDEVVHKKTVTKQAPGLFGSWLELLIFHIFFTKCKPQTDDRVSRSCDSSLDSFRLSALLNQYLTNKIHKFHCYISNKY